MFRIALVLALAGLVLRVGTVRV
jgi:cytochrome oxidase Cu insertion factor (SCO1/SenC/PrrC family)